MGLWVGVWARVLGEGFRDQWYFYLRKRRSPQHRKNVSRFRDVLGVALFDLFEGK